ncbi:class F sortase [Streptomyces sp. NPDC003035]|uniref:class F sortase n=1 Tax=Streptomyces sp. NPDC003035 TaxID=3364676 RepID=UPI0036CC97D3
MRSRHRAGPVAAVAMGGVLMAAGWTLLDRAPTRADEGTLPAALSSPRSGNPSAAPVSVTVGGPHRLHATVRPVTAAPGGDMSLPRDGDFAGWWAMGAPPGASRGTVLIAGHVDTEEGLGAFAELHRLDVGARVEVRGADGRVHRYRVTARRTYDRTELPGDLFSADGPPRLALLTCAGDYDRSTGRYDDNLVLYAAPAADA